MYCRKALKISQQNQNYLKILTGYGVCGIKKTGHLAGSDRSLWWGGPVIWFRKAAAHSAACLLAYYCPLLRFLSHITQKNFPGNKKTYCDISLANLQYILKRICVKYKLR